MGIFQRGKSGIYWYRFVIKGRKYRGTTRRRNRAAAEKFAIKLQEQILTCGPPPLPPPPPVPDLGQWLKRLIDAALVRGLTRSHVIAMLEDGIEALREDEPLRPETAGLWAGLM
jgi:hypothetical protein